MGRPKEFRGESQYEKWCRRNLPKQLYGCPYCDAYSSDLTMIREHMANCNAKNKEG